jgi:electron transport complex protein RnfG
MSESPHEPGYRQRTVYHAALLGAVALLAGAFLVVGDLSTREAIAMRRAEDLKASLSQVIRPGLHDSDLLDDVIELTVSGTELVAYRARLGEGITAVAYRVLGAGYGGPIELLMGVDRDGRILGVRVLAHRETPGLGDKIEAARSDWIRSFDGLTLEDARRSDFAVSKDGGRFDAFTGATITPRAVVWAVRDGMETFAASRAQLLTPAPTAWTQGR